MKDCGVLCHITSLVSKYGVGDFGKSSRDFIDFLSENNIKYWQILPLTETNDKNCPYGSMSYFAFDTMFVDIDNLVDLGLVSLDEIIKIETCDTEGKVNYLRVKKTKLELLEKAYSNITDELLNKVYAFGEQNPHFFDYAYYKVLLEKNNTKDYRQTSVNLWLKGGKEYIKFAKENREDITKYVFWQYLLYQQWQSVRRYAKDKGVKIIGDMPIYPEPTSFDVFSYPECFLLNKERNPIVLGGVPADEFCDTTQNWGNCVYDWDYLQKTNYSFLINKIKTLLDYYDILRLDHFLGYVEHYEIDACTNIGKWRLGGGNDFFQELASHIDLGHIVVEDLGTRKVSAEKVKKDFSLKGMSVLQMATNNMHYLPQNVGNNDIYYLGTHDNDTFIGYLSSLDKSARQEFLNLINLEDGNNEAILVKCVNKMLNSECKLIVLQIQDILMQGSNSRMNIPGQAKGCWEYKLPLDYKENFRKNILKFNGYKKE